VAGPPGEGAAGPRLRPPIEAPGFGLGPWAALHTPPANFCKPTPRLGAHRTRGPAARRPAHAVAGTGCAGGGAPIAPAPLVRGAGAGDPRPRRARRRRCIAASPPTRLRAARRAAHNPTRRRPPPPARAHSGALTPGAGRRCSFLRDPLDFESEAPRAAAVAPRAAPLLPGRPRPHSNFGSSRAAHLTSRERAARLAPSRLRLLRPPGG
jgi:hypothetical protein